MKIVKLGVSFIIFLFIYSFVGLLIDLLVHNSYNEATYTIRRLIQLALNMTYIFYITQTSHINLSYKIKPRNMILYIVVLFSFIFLYESTIDVFINQYFSRDAVSHARDSSIQTLFDYPVAFFIQACISAPLLEEVLVRGVFYEILRERLSVVWSVTITSIFFSIMHFDSFNTLFYIMIGIIFSYIYVKTGSITYCVILHICVNAFSFLSYYMNFTPKASLSASIVICSAVVVIGTMLYLLKPILKRIRIEK